MLSKSKYLILAIALLMSSCAKVQEDKAELPDIPIAYQVANASQTKVDGTVYPTDIPFVSYAWYLPATSNWGADRASSEPYIVGETVSYFITGLWTTDIAYYWPSAGSLSFISYSPAEPIRTSNQVTVHNVTGLTLNDWNVTDNKTVDFMVADRIDGQTQNGANAGYTGVPTVFRHKLSKVTFNVSADAELQNRCILYSVRLVNVYQQGTYTQFGEEGADDVWSNHSDAGTAITVYVYDNADGLTVPTVSTQTGDSMFMIPQELTNSRTTGGSDVPCVEIVYSYLTSTNRDNPVKVTATVPLTEFKITGTETASTEWSAGYSIVYNIAFGGAPILFNPIYGDWGNGGDYTIIL